MAGGVVVVTAAGVGLGGASGASVATLRPHRQVVRLREGCRRNETTVTFANGFLSDGKTGWGDWERTVRSVTPTVYRLTWGAKELKSLTALVGPGVTQLSQQAMHRWQSTQRRARALLGPLRCLHRRGSARTRACGQDAGLDDGAVLAHAIVRADLRSVVLVGFSLAWLRVMTAAAETLATRDRPDPRIDSIHLLGAAVVN